MIIRLLTFLVAIATAVPGNGQSLDEIDHDRIRDFGKQIDEAAERGCDSFHQTLVEFRQSGDPDQFVAAGISGVAGLTRKNLCAERPEHILNLIDVTYLSITAPDFLGPLLQKEYAAVLGDDWALKLAESGYVTGALVQVTKDFVCSLGQIDPNFDKEEFSRIDKIIPPVLCPETFSPSLKRALFWIEAFDLTADELWMDNLHFPALKKRSALSPFSFLSFYLMSDRNFKKQMRKEKEMRRSGASQEEIVADFNRFSSKSLIQLAGFTAANSLTPAERRETLEAAQAWTPTPLVIE